MNCAQFHYQIISKRQSNPQMYIVFSTISFHISMCSMLMFLVQDTPLFCSETYSVEKYIQLRNTFS